MHLTVSRSFKRNPLSNKVISALATLSITASLNAQATWTGSTNQNWNTNSNWTSGPAAPTGVVTVNTSTGNYPIVSATPSFTPSAIVIGSGSGNSGRVDVSAGSLSTPGPVRVGSNGGTGSLNVTGGSVTAQELLLANTDTTASSTVNVGGSGVINSNGATLLANGTNPGAIATSTLNVNSGGTLNSEGDLVVAFAGNGSTGTVNIAAGGVVNVATTTKRWLIMNQWDTSSGVLNVNGGTLNLNAGTDIRFSTGFDPAAASNGVSAINLNSGSINMGAAGIIDLNYNADRAVSNSINLNGGVLRFFRFLSGKVTSDLI